MEEKLLLKNQLCFPLYACAKETVRLYKPLLEKLDLTYTQYLAMMVMWEDKEMSLSSLGDKLYLDSGTLTPLIKKLVNKGYLARRRSEIDERELVISLTESGVKLKERAVKVPDQVACQLDLSEEEAGELYRLCYKVLKGFAQNEQK